MEMDFTVEGETVSGPVIFAVDQEMIDFAQQFDEETTAEDLLSDLDVDLDETIDGVTAEPYETDQLVGTQLIFDNVPLSQLNEAFGSDKESLQIVYHADSQTYEVTGMMDLSDVTDEADFGDEELFPPELVESMLGTFDINISITFPGEVLETTGEVSGTTVTWKPVIGESTEIHAVASAPGSAHQGAGTDENGVAAPGDANDSDSSSHVLIAVLVGLGVLVVLAAIAVGVWLMRRSSQPASADAAMVPPQAGMPASDQPAPTAPEQPANGDQPTQ